jgi:hypothetical protein
MQYFDGSQQIEAVKGLVKSKLNETFFGHVVAAALICNNSNDHDLDCDVLKCISKLTTLNDDLDFLKKTKPKKFLKDFVLPQNVLYTFLVKTVTIWGQVNPLSFDDGKWKCLVLLDVCGLTRKVYSSDEWKLLRSYVDPKIFVDKETEFLAFLRRERTFTLCLCFQHDYYDFLESARPENVASVKLENIAFSILLLLAVEQRNKGI